MAYGHFGTLGHSGTGGGERATIPQLREVAVAINWIIWIVFVVEFGVKWAADRTLAFPRKAWFDVLLIVLTPPFGVPDVMQAVHSLRLLRIVRLVRAFGVATMGLRLTSRHFHRQKFHHVLVVACATVVLGAVGIYALESGENKGIRRFWRRAVVGNCDGHDGGKWRCHACHT